MFRLKHIKNPEKAKNFFKHHLDAYHIIATFLDTEKENIDTVLKRNLEEDDRVYVVGNPKTYLIPKSDIETLDWTDILGADWDKCFTITAKNTKLEVKGSSEAVEKIEKELSDCDLRYRIDSDIVYIHSKSLDALDRAFSKLYENKIYNISVVCGITEMDVYSNSFMDSILSLRGNNVELIDSYDSEWNLETTDDRVLVYENVSIYSKLMEEIRQGVLPSEAKVTLLCNDKENSMYTVAISNMNGERTMGMEAQTLITPYNSYIGLKVAPELLDEKEFLANKQFCRVIRADSKLYNLLVGNIRNLDDFLLGMNGGIEAIYQVYTLHGEYKKGISSNQTINIKIPEYTIVVPKYVYMPEKDYIGIELKDVTVKAPEGSKDIRIFDNKVEFEFNGSLYTLTRKDI